MSREIDKDKQEVQAAIEKLQQLEKRWRVDPHNDLFVTLHRTIEQQIQILSGGGSPFVTLAALDLARAILDTRV